MAQLSIPEKHYLISVNKDEDICTICPFEVHTVTQSMGDYTMLGIGGHGFYGGPPTTRIDGQLYGTMRILKAVDIDNITYEDIMNLLKE